MNVEDQLGQLPLVVLSSTAFVQAADPGAVVGASVIRTRHGSLALNRSRRWWMKREVFPRRCVVDDGFRRFVQDLVLKMQVPVLAPTSAQLLACLCERGGKIVSA